MKKAQIQTEIKQQSVKKVEAVPNILPATGFVRASQILGDKKRGISAIIPVSRSNWWAGVKSGIYPAPIQLSARITCWRVEDIKAFIEKAGV